MDYQLYSKNVLITDSLKEFIAVKMQRLEKFAAHSTSCHLDISRDSHHHSGDVFRFEINITIPKKLLRIEESHSDIRAAVDSAIDKMAIQLTKIVERRRDSERKQSRQE